MSTPDIVERLREGTDCSDCFTKLTPVGELCVEAADTIESLCQQAELWKSAYLEQVELHNKTLDELREAEKRVKKLEVCWTGSGVFVPNAQGKPTAANEPNEG